MEISNAERSWRENLPPGIAQKKSAATSPSVAIKICPQCAFAHPKEQWSHLFSVCSECGYHDMIGRKQRIEMLLDEVYHEIGGAFFGQDFLQFSDTQPYTKRLEQAIAKTGYTEALSVLSGRLDQHRIVLATFDFDFIGGSMSAAVGERFVAGVEYCIQHKYPLVCQALSGGARMQEGVRSLVQMSRTSAALARLSQAKIPYIVTLVSPCMGGVSASLASLGDVTIAEPNALIGFTGPRVIAQTLGQKLPEGFQSSAFMQACGQVDQIVPRKDLKKTIARWVSRLTFGRSVCSPIPLI